MCTELYVFKAAALYCGLLSAYSDYDTDYEAETDAEGDAEGFRNTEY
jgi:hypothetical protein